MPLDRSVDDDNNMVEGFVTEYSQREFNTVGYSLNNSS